MTGFVRPVATLALSLAVIIGCGGAPPVTTRPAEPTATEDVATVEPIPTHGVTPATPAGPTASTAEMDFGTDWPTTVEVTLSSGRFIDEFAHGTFTSTGTSRDCGVSSFAPGAFLFGFPHDADPHDVEDVDFGGDELVPGTSTSSFRINVSIAAAANGAHPLTSLNTTDPQSPASGSAQLSVVNGARKLVVDVADKDGVSIHLTAVCSPI